MENQHKERVSITAFAVVFTVFFVLFNPLMLRIGYIIHPPMERITRLYNIVPFCMALVFPLYMAERSPKLAKFRGVFILILAAVFVLMLKEVPKRLGEIEFNKQKSLESLSQNAMFYNTVRDTIPAGSVDMLNLPLTTWWTTYFPHYIVAHYFAFIFPPNIDETDRLSDVKQYYSDPYDSRAEEILRRYGVNYVFFLNREISPANIGKV